jgi:hypothetical protein
LAVPAKIANSLITSVPHADGRIAVRASLEANDKARRKRRVDSDQFLSWQQNSAGAAAMLMAVNAHGRGSSSLSYQARQ